MASTTPAGAVARPILLRPTFIKLPRRTGGAR